MADGWRGAKRSLSKSYNPKRTFIAYLACCCCGHWWPVCEVYLRNLIDPCRFVCPFCYQGRKRVCDDWDGETRRMPVPAMLDVRLPKEEETDG